MKRASYIFNQQNPFTKELNRIKRILQVYDKMYYGSVTRHGYPDQPSWDMIPEQFDRNFERQCRDDEDINEE